MNAIIRTKDLRKSYAAGGQDFSVLNGVNIEIGEGEFVSIMGPSGSGKSTLLYLLGSLDAPSSGQIFVRGAELSGLSDAEASKYRRKQLGFVFQFYNLVPNLTVEENILLPVLLDGQSAKGYRARLRELIGLVGLSGYEKRLPAELSGGQQQRVAVARALIHDPDIILADEPIGNLDSKTGNGVMELFREVNAERRKTIVQVTHSREAAAYGTRVIMLRDGETVEAS